MSLLETSYTEDLRVIRWKVTDVEPCVRPEDPWENETEVRDNWFTVAVWRDLLSA